MAKAIQTLRDFENLKEEDLVFFDIETARAVEDIKGSHLEEAWLYKSRYQNEINKKTGLEYTPEEYYMEKAPLYAPFGRIVCIVVGRIKENKLHLKAYADYDEKNLLEEFNNDLNTVYGRNPNTRMVSFNGIGFDTPFIVKRCMINGIKACPIIAEESFAKPWELGCVDLSKIWRGNAFYPDSLIAVASAFGLPSPKDALDGSMVSDAFYAGRLEEIVTYCYKDVETTARVFRKMTFREDLEKDCVYNNGGSQKKLSVLESLYASNSLTNEVKTKLKDLVDGKKISKREKKLLFTLLRGVYIRCDFENNDQDTKAIILQKENEINNFLNSL